MLLPLMLSLAGSALAPATAASARVVSDDPPIKVWLNHDNYYRGDKARVNARLADDGYVVVLRADADGRVRVLFPLDHALQVRPVRTRRSLGLPGARRAAIR